MRIDTFCPEKQQRSKIFAANIASPEWATFSETFSYISLSEQDL